MASIAGACVGEALLIWNMCAVLLFPASDKLPHDAHTILVPL